MVSVYYGTRPEYIKVCRLYYRLKELSVACELVKVCQHSDLIEYCDSDRDVMVDTQNSHRLNSIVSSCLNDEVINSDTKLVIVQGDTATAFAVSLNAFNRKVPIAHVEAGLRTYDLCNPFPEEAYRRLISVMAADHFCVSSMGKDILEREKVQGEIHVVGNTALDNIVSKRDAVEYQNEVLVTLHRRENRDQMKDWLLEIAKLAEEKQHIRFVLPVHPSVDKSVIDEIQRLSLPNFVIVSPLTHQDTIEIMRKCLYVITDSGGIQEESSFLRKKSIVCRKTTERQEGLGIFSVLCKEPKLLKNCVSSFIETSVIPSDDVCPYGDGSAVERIAQIIKGKYYEVLS